MNHHTAPFALERLSQEGMGAPPEYAQLLDARTIASGCPAIAKHAVHLAVAPCGTRALRVLRIVEEECKILHSRSRTPYLLELEGE